MNSQSYIILEYGYFRRTEQFIIFEMFVAYTTFVSFLKPGGSAYGLKEHIR